jgi:plastocyanin
VIDNLEKEHRMSIGRTLRLTAAVALLIGGLVHLQLYFEGYRSIDKIGPSFLANAIASGLVAAALAARNDWPVRLAGIGVAAGTIGAFIVSRQGDGLFNFREQGLKPSPQAVIALVVEIVAVVALAASFLPAVSDDVSPSLGKLATATALSVALLVGLGAYWAAHYDGAIRATAGGVQITNFAFGPADLTVTKGTTVTWTNADAVQHSVVADDASFQSDALPKGTTFVAKFDSTGQFAYRCGIHPQMAGTITVIG